MVLLIPGIYFTAMGWFAFGCAAGNCYTGYQRHHTQDTSADASFEEIKNKP
jgi:hypothetical protein